MSGPNHPRGTTNRNDRGSAAERRRRKQWLLDTFGDGTYASCSFCEDELDYGTITVDRIVAGCLGGTYARNNIRPACMRCNSLQGTALRERLKKTGLPCAGRFCVSADDCCNGCYQHAKVVLDIAAPSPRMVPAMTFT